MDAMRFKWHRTPGPIAFVYYWVFVHPLRAAGRDEADAPRRFMGRMNRYVYCII